MSLQSAITPKGLTDFVNDYVNTVGAETGVTVDSSVGSILRALAVASAINDMFNQAQIIQTQLDANINTAVAGALDNLVNQFVPPFTSRVQASAASSAPVPPTALQSPATTTFLWVGSVSQWYVSQALSITYTTYGAACVISSVQPTTTLTVAAVGGSTSLTVASTTGMFVGQTLTLTDGLYVADVTVALIVSSTVVDVSIVTTPVTHTFATATTVVQLIGVVGITGLTFNSGTILSDLVAGATVVPTNMLAGGYFYRNSPTPSTVNIPAQNGSVNGSIITTPDGTISYQVVPDTTNPNYNTSLNAYVIPANVAGVYTKIVAMVAGSASNVAAGALSVLSSPVSGVDGVTNTYAISNGADTEIDTLLRNRFQQFMSSQSGTVAAVTSAIAGVSTGLQYGVIENVANDGVTSQPGNFVVIVGDVTGSLTPTILSDVTSAVNAVRPITVTFSVIPPTLVNPTITVVIIVNTSTGVYTQSGVQAAVQTAIYNSFLGQAAGVGWNFDQVFDVVMNVSGVTQIQKLVINGNGFDRTGGTYTVIGVGPGVYPQSAFTLTRPSVSNITVS